MQWRDLQHLHITTSVILSCFVSFSAIPIPLTENLHIFNPLWCSSICNGGICSVYITKPAILSCYVSFSAIPTPLIENLQIFIPLYIQPVLKHHTSCLLTKQRVLFTKLIPVESCELSSWVLVPLDSEIVLSCDI